MKKTLLVTAMLLILCAFGVSAQENYVSEPYPTVNPYTEVKEMTYDFTDNLTVASDFLISLTPDNPVVDLHLKLECITVTEEHSLTLKLKEAETNEVVFEKALDVTGETNEVLITGYYDETESYAAPFENGKAYYIELSDCSLIGAKGTLKVGNYDITETNNFIRNTVYGISSMTHIKYVTLGENESEINIEFSEITNPLSNYYISLYKIDAENSDNSKYIVKYSGPISTKGFTFTGLDNGLYRVSISSSVNKEYVHGIVSTK